MTSVLGLRVSPAPFAVVADRAMDLTRTRDPFDRLIVANAMADRAALLTADRAIFDEFEQATWP